MGIKIPTPPKPVGSVENQMKQMWSYLFRLAELMNKQSGGNEDVRKTS